MTIQFEKTKATLELLKLEIQSQLNRLEDILAEITEREKKIIEDSLTKGAKDGRNPRPTGTGSRT